MTLHNSEPVRAAAAGAQSWPRRINLAGVLNAEIHLNEEFCNGYKEWIQGG